MSVIGIDFGNNNCVVAQAKRGGIDVVLNENSNRKNPSLVSLQNKQRFIGEQASSMTRSNLKNTIVNIKRLLGRKFAEEEVQTELATSGFKIVEGENGNVAINVSYNDEEITLTTEQATSMLLGKLKWIAEYANSGAKVADSVISVPGYFTDAQRYALLNAAEIAGLKVLSCMNEHTAVALAYGIWKSARNVFHESEPHKVMFLDMGHSSFTASVAFFIQGKLEVKSACFDTSLGGRLFDQVIIDELLAAFKEKTGKDLSQDKKALVKLQVAAEKAKKTLSPAGVNEARITVECLFEDTDLNHKLTLERLNELIEPLLARMEAPVKQALAEAGVESAADLKAVEIVGGGTRVSSVKSRLCEILGLPATGLSTTLNADESVARGCALQCAILSPLFKVKEFNVIDTVAYPVRLCWEQIADATPAAMEEEGEGEGEGDAPTEGENGVVIFKRNDETPKIRRVTLRRNSTFEVNAVYEEGAKLSKAASSDIGRWVISGLTAPEGETPRVRVNVKHDVHGIFSVTSAQMMEEIKEDPEAAKEGEEKEGEKKVAEEKEGDAPKKKRFRKVELKVEGFTSAMTRSAMNLAVETEANMAQQDRIIQETSDQRNELEAYIYDVRDKATPEGELGPFFTADACTAVADALQTGEDWLYSDEGFDSTKAVYADKLKALQAMVNPAVNRKQEHELRPAATKELLAAAEMYKSLAQSTEDRYDHISDEDRERVKTECSTTESWVYDQMAAQDKLEQTADPVLLVETVRARKTALANVCRPIMNKPRPKPAPKAEEAAPAPATEEKKDEAGAKMETETDDKKEDTKMDVEAPTAEPTPASATMELD